MRGLGVAGCPSGLQQQAGGQLRVRSCCSPEGLALAAARSACVAKSAEMPPLLAPRRGCRPACRAPSFRARGAAARSQAELGERQAKPCGAPLAQP